MDLSRVRNFGVVAHIDAGKTTVSERILFDAGVQHRCGNVDEGDTVLDWMAEERARGITITAAASTVPWRDHQLNLIDTPGHVDFTVEVERSMRVLDGAVLVLDGVAGVQAQSETVWRQMQRHQVPGLVFVNKLDRKGADFLRVVRQARQRLGARVRPLQFPLFDNERLSGLVDLLALRTWVFDGDGVRATAQADAVPASCADEVGVLRAELLEDLAGDDETLLEAVTAGRSIVPEVALRALRRRVLARTLVPVLCGAALRNLGIQPLLDAIVDLLPSPLDLPPVIGQDPRNGQRIERSPAADAPACALAFKVQLTPHGDLTFVRVYAGTIVPGSGLWNPRLRQHERVTRVLRIHAEHGQPLERAQAGDIVALVGPRHTATGDTLCTKDAPIVLESLTVPDPVLTLWVEPRSTADRDKLHQALLRLAHEDPSLRVREDADTGRWLMSGMGELHLEVVRHRLQSDFHVACAVGAPSVAYREAPRRPARAEAHVEHAVGAKTIVGDVEVEVQPDPDCVRPEIEWAPGCPVPGEYRPAIEEALRLECHVGPRLGYPLVHARVTVVGARIDRAHDSEVAFVEAATKALRAALEQSGIDLLEPWMRIEVEARAEFASGILNDLSQRRAEVDDVVADGDLRTIHGTVALRRMFGYATAVRSLSQGQAAFSLTPVELRPTGE
ncbi:MAG: elongation factor G [Planctomycetota bacterium]